MHGDVIEFNKMICQVEIQGYEGAYRTIDGVIENCAVGSEGFLVELITGNRFRAKWGQDVKIIRNSKNKL